MARTAPARTDSTDQRLSDLEAKVDSLSSAVFLIRSELDAIIAIRQPFDTRSIEAARQEAQRYNAAIESNVRLHNKCVELQTMVDMLRKQIADMEATSNAHEPRPSELHPES